MEMLVGFHFHGYQPGDVVSVEFKHDDIRFIERISHIIADNHTYKNWTEYMLKRYPKIFSFFETLGKENLKFSLDVEPWTIKMSEDLGINLLSTIRSIKDFADIVATVPYHPIMPHLEKFEMEVLSGIMWEIHKRINPDVMWQGVWLPECAYSSDVIKAIAEQSFRLGNIQGTYLFLDSTQIIKPPEDYAKMSCNFIKSVMKIGVVARDKAISNAFAFREKNPRDIVSMILSRRDNIKEEKGIPYFLSLASDLETFIYSDDQMKRFYDIYSNLKEKKISCMRPSDYFYEKSMGTMKKWIGEFFSEEYAIKVKENSSWSDYTDTQINGPSDTRWTGLRRFDSLIIFRNYGRRKISQIWKQGFMRLMENINRFIRNCCIFGLKNIGGGELLEFLIKYHSIHFSAICGNKSNPFNDCNYVTGDENTALELARMYYLGLMANRSCPRFWENIDTRVTFQSVIFMTSSLLECHRIMNYIGEKNMAEKAVKIFQRELVNFEKTYDIYNIQELFGYHGWEVMRDSWISSIQSEIPSISCYNVVKRAAIYEIIKSCHESSHKFIENINFKDDDVCADVNHIFSERSFPWKNKDWCENSDR